MAEDGRQEEEREEHVDAVLDGCLDGCGCCLLNAILSAFVGVMIVGMPFAVMRIV